MIFGMLHDTIAAQCVEMVVLFFFFLGYSGFAAELSARVRDMGVGVTIMVPVTGLFCRWSGLHQPPILGLCCTIITHFTLHDSSVTDGNAYSFVSVTVKMWRRPRCGHGPHPRTTTSFFACFPVFDDAALSVSPLREIVAQKEKTHGVESPR